MKALVLITGGFSTKLLLDSLAATGGPGLEGGGSGGGNTWDLLMAAATRSKL